MLPPCAIPVQRDGVAPDPEGGTESARVRSEVGTHAYRALRPRRDLPSCGRRLGSDCITAGPFRPLSSHPKARGHAGCVFLFPIVLLRGRGLPPPRLSCPSRPMGSAPRPARTGGAAVGPGGHGGDGGADTAAGSGGCPTPPWARRLGGALLPPHHHLTWSNDRRATVASRPLYPTPLTLPLRRHPPRPGPSNAASRARRGCRQGRDEWSLVKGVPCARHQSIRTRSMA